MTDKDWRVRIDDMLEAISRCLSYVDEMTASGFAADSRTQDAVARNLEILGEAANRIPDQVAARHPRVPWETMAEMRHVLIHEYHSVDPEILYRTVHNDLPPLIPMLEAVLADPPSDPPSEGEDAPS